MRGENGNSLRDVSGRNGTSPRARGKRPFRSWFCRFDRNIPACAGKTHHVHHDAYSAAEHPRVRGENAYTVVDYRHPGGTSPRARGKRAAALCQGCPVRNIPACAGKTYIGSLRGSSIQEHPRVRGENWVKTYSGLPVWGTSPRARGKPFAAGALEILMRNIPACAGKTSCTPHPQDEPREHPRVRGENVHPVSAQIAALGTSPRARGKRQWVRHKSSKQRNIPACAGKTLPACGEVVGCKEHPRVRGENTY